MGEDEDTRARQADREKLVELAKYIGELRFDMVSEEGRVAVVELAAEMLERLLKFDEPRPQRAG